MRFGQRVKLIMEQKGIGQNELARKANLSSSGISAALNESGNPRESTMISIYEALGMTPAEFWNEGRTVETLSKQEMELLNIFDQLNESGKDLLIAQAKNIIEQLPLRKKGFISSANL